VFSLVFWLVFWGVSALAKVVSGGETIEVSFLIINDFFIGSSPVYSSSLA
jgi:hypothetical protein